MDFKLYEIPANIKNAIYFLVDNNEVVYVGKTKNGIKRITQHTNKNFNSFGFIEYKENELDYYEDFYIMKYQPKYNNTYSCYRASLNGCYSKLSSKIRKYINIFEFANYIEKEKIDIKKFKNISTITKKDFEYIKEKLNKEYGVSQ